MLLDGINSNVFDKQEGQNLVSMDYLFLFVSWLLADAYRYEI